MGSDLGRPAVPAPVRQVHCSYSSIKDGNSQDVAWKIIALNKRKVCSSTIGLFYSSCSITEKKKMGSRGAS
jgi:hypothetical protein